MQIKKQIVFTIDKDAFDDHKDIDEVRQALYGQYHSVTVYPNGKGETRIVCEEEVELCPFYNETVLPDEDGMCSLCGKHEAHDWDNFGKCVSCGKWDTEGERHG